MRNAELSNARAMFTIANLFRKRQLRDPLSLIMLVVVPLAIAFIFGYAERNGHDTLAFGVSSPNSPVAAQFVQLLKSEPSFRVHSFDTRAALDAAVRRGDVSAGVVLPTDYDEQVSAGRVVPVAVVGDQTQSAYRGVNLGIGLMTDHENQLLAVARQLRAADGKPVGASVAPYLARAEDMTSAGKVDRKLVIAHKVSTVAGVGRVTAGMLVFFMFEEAIVNSKILEDRKRGVIARMATTQTRTVYIVGGDILGRVFVALIQAFVIVVFGAVFFGVHWGNPAAVAVIILCFAVLAASAGALIDALFKTSAGFAPMRLIALYATLGVLGGCFFPLTVVPSWLRVVGHLSPHAWAVDALGRLGTTDSGIAGVFIPVLLLATVATLLAALAVRRLSRIVGN